MSAQLIEEALVLNVDDDAAARYTKTRFLMRAGYQVVEADTGAEALRQIQARKPDLVVLDVRLPDMSGLEVCARIKQNPQHASTLILQTSASFVESRDRVAALDVGADMYLVEPMDADEFVAVVHALLRLRSAERKAAESDRRFYTLARAAPVGIFHTDAHGFCTFVNDTWCRITGLTPQTGLGQAWREAVHPEDGDRVIAAFMEAMTKGAKFEAEYRFLHRSGEVRWVWGQALPELNEAAELIGYIGSITDITERKESEEMLREAARSKDEFLAMLSHELRNPLAPLRTTLEIIKLKPNSEAVSGELMIMDRQLRQLTRLTDDLFDVARFSSNRIPLRKEPTDLCRIAGMAIETSRPVVQAAGHDLEVVLADAPLLLEGDPVRLAQVVSNLLNNAAKFTPRGGHIEIVVTREDEVGIVQVKDNGIGIRQEEIGRIFDLFTQARTEGEQPQHGLGIGLALSKRIVDLHGGTLRTESAGPGMGSAFTVTLPLATEMTLDIGEPEEQKRAFAPQATPRRILVVDDNADASASLAILLQTQGHDVQIAADGPRALEFAARFLPDVVLLDIGLPGMSGLDVARQIRLREWGKDMLLIALTGWGQPADRDRSRAAGVDHHLVKPVTLADVASLLE